MRVLSNQLQLYDSHSQDGKIKLTMKNMSFEQEIKLYLKNHKIRFHNNCNSLEKPDFSIINSNGNIVFTFDVKEKRQKYNMNHWSKCKIPQPFFFILDDLAARKIFRFSPKCGVIIRDNTQKKFVLFSGLDLFLMPKTRINRPIHRNQHGLKGKWFVDLRNGKSSTGLDEIFEEIKTYLTNFTSIFQEHLPCYHPYWGEEILEQGTERRPEHWETDIKTTR